MSDRLGRRRLLVVGLVLFVGASVLCAFAPTGTWLVAARALQGIGGSMILPTTLALLNATFRGSERGIAFAVWGSTIGSMAAVGPVLGGWLTSSFSWHGRGLRDRAAHPADPRRRPGRPLGPGLLDAVDLAPGGLGPRHRDPRHGAVHHAALEHRVEA